MIERAPAAALAIVLAVTAGCFDAFPGGVVLDAEAPGATPTDQQPPEGGAPDRGPDAAPDPADAQVDPMGDARVADGLEPPPDAATDARLDATVDAIVDATPMPDPDMAVEPDMAIEPDMAPCMPRGAEVCNGLDDDCDGTIDEDALGLGPCALEVDGCPWTGELVCEGGLVRCDPTSIDVQDEACNGADDDCDGLVDEETVCGQYVEAQCQLWLGWSDRNLGAAPGMAPPVWATCPPGHPELPQPPPDAEDIACVGTAGDGLFRRLELGGDFNDDDRLAVAFTCSDPENPALAGWIQSHCAIFLGMAGERAADDQSDWPTWGPCPAELEGVDGRFSCISTGYDGRFRVMQSQRGNDNRKSLAIAVRCQDEQEPERAEALQQSFIAVVGFARDDNDGADDRSPSWSSYPAETGDRGVDNDGESHSVASPENGAFQSFEVGHNIDGGSALSIALRADPARIPPPE